MADNKVKWHQKVANLHDHPTHNKVLTVLLYIFSALFLTLAIFFFVWAIGEMILDVHNKATTTDNYSLVDLLKDDPASMVFTLGAAISLLLAISCKMLAKYHLRNSKK